MTTIPHIPESAPFTAEQRAWLNGFLAGLFSQVPGGVPAPHANDAPAKAGEPLLVLYGSQTGSAEGLAKKFAKESEARGFMPKIAALNDFEAAGFPAAKKAVIISSTWGDGEPPDNAVNFWNWLNAASAPRLESLQFAVLGLGDRNYSDFCGASKKFDDRLAALGAQRVAPRGECDVDFEGAAKGWIDGLWGKLGSNGAPVNGTNGAHGVTRPTSESNGVAAFGKGNPFPAKLLVNRLLNKPGSGKEVRHYEISLEGSGLSYEVGDALAVIPQNCPQLVGDVIAALKFKGDEAVNVGGADMPLRTALMEQLDIGKPPMDLLKAVAAREPAGELAALLAPERAEDFKKWLWGRGVVDLLPSLAGNITPADFVKLLRKLSLRLYSISSSPKAHPGEVHLTVSAVRYQSFGRERKGVASTYLADRVGPTDLLKVFVQPSHGFKPPANGDTPMIMVGPGTGIAPFRAFLEERAATEAKGKNWLFFGDQKAATDFLYQEQLNAWQRSGFLTRLDLAFSRDQAEKIYVQDRMLQNSEDLWAWLEAGAHFYVCGDASCMAKDVDAALHKLIETAGRKSPDEAKAYVAKLKADKRYQRDVY